jgi:hypothetical protein
MRQVLRISVTVLFLAVALWLLLAGGAEAAQLVRSSFSIPGVQAGCF